MEWEWKYRIVKSSDGDTSQFSVEECLLDEDGIIQSHTIELTPKFETIDDLKNQLNEMLECLDKGIIGEIKSTIKGCCCDG
tara:strand:+ start:4715 stop:4957 length:243 start_codon:yes stop_codon:yes gene_type:complete